MQQHTTHHIDTAMTNRFRTVWSHAFANNKHASAHLVLTAHRAFLGFDRDNTPKAYDYCAAKKVHSGHLDKGVGAKSDASGSH